MALQLHYSSFASPRVSASRDCKLSSRESDLGAHLRRNGGRIGRSHHVGLSIYASSGGDFELTGEEVSPLCEHPSLSSRRRSSGVVGEEVSPSIEQSNLGCSRKSFSEIWRTRRLLGDCWESLCSRETGDWRKVSSAALLWSSGLVTAPSVGAPVPVAVQGLNASDFVAAAVTLAGALGILQFFDELAKRDLVEKKLSRKLCHILSGTVFMLFWPLFSAAPLAKYLAAFAPAANGLRMLGLGLGLWKNEALVKAISRGGSQSELLRGPLYYAITITVATLFFWRNSPVGACAVATLCAGDGFADIVGRKWGKRKLPYNSSKSILGAVTFFVMASLACMGYVAYFSAFGFFIATPRMYLASVGVALVSAIVESLPLPLDDNFTVPFSAIGIGMLLLPA